MTKTTTNLGLTKVNTTVQSDGALADDELDFNLDTFLNDNWDKIDTAVGQKLSVTDTTVTKAGNAFNGANQLVQLTSGGKLPALDGSLLTNIGGALKLNALGTIINGVTLPTNSLTTAYVNAPIAIELPTNLISGVENTVVFDFTTSSSSQPTISTSGSLKWSDKNSGKAPLSYSTLLGVRNRLVFITNDAGATWEVEYKTYGGVLSNWTQPLLSSNGVWGGTTFAVKYSNPANEASQPCYYCMDSADSTLCVGPAGSSLCFSSPYPLRISQFAILNSIDGYITTYSIYGSNDDVTYTLLTTGSNSNTTNLSSWAMNVPAANQDFYKYYKITMGSTGSNWVIRTLGISAQYIAT